MNPLLSPPRPPQHQELTLVVRGHDHTEPSISPGVLAEQTDEWAEHRRYMGVEVPAEARPAATPAAPEQPVSAATGADEQGARSCRRR